MEISAYKSFKIFIASPGDVQEERKAADSVIAAVDRICRETIGLRAECQRWEELPPLTPQPNEGEAQDVIIKDLLDKCQVFVLILNKRYGTVTSGQDKSNTEREVQAALDLLQRRRNFSFLSYFRNIPKDEDPGQQQNKLERLKGRLRKRKIFFHTFDTPEEFKDKFTHDLYYILLKFKHAATKVKALRRFWQLGITEAQDHPRLAIIYPPVNRSFMKGQSPDRVWLERLVPHIVFEDFKALHKIDKTLRIIGHDDISTYNTVGVTQEINDINRVWLCLPRNILALNQLNNYEDKALFKLGQRRIHKESYIEWRPTIEQAFFRIESPLSKYLQLQRSKIPGGEWTAEHGRIFAKDYAILARFSDKTGRRPTIEGSLKDYFIAGIRGLGTWGAAWFIDRRYMHFIEKEKEDEPIQLLLEVTYQNEVIDNVRDVSQEPESYFRNENRLNTIRANIKNHFSK